MRYAKVAGATALVLLSACAGMRGGSGSDDVSMNVGGSRAEALAVARTQLVHHGYEVTAVGEEMLVTSPKRVPEYLREVSTARPDAQQWFLVVSAEKIRFFSGTRLRVAGYLLPPGAGTTQAVADGKRLEQTAIPVTTSNPKLFREVEVVSSWIESASKRK